MNPLPQKHIESNILKQVIERTVNGVIITDEAGFTTWINQGFERITGLSADEILGKKPGAVLQGPDTDPLVIEVMSSAISNAEPFDVTILNYKKNGETFWNYIECLPLFEGETHTGFLAIQTDVTPSVEFQNQLIEANKRAQENSERLLLAFAGGFVGSWDWNPTKDDLYFHESWENLVGAEPGTLEHKIETWVKRIHPDDVDLFTQQLALVTCDKHDHFVSEHRILCEPNQYRWTMARGQVVARDQNGNPTRMVGVHLDISEQKRTQRLLDERNDLLQTILEVIPFAVSWKDTESRYLGCNNLFIEFSGYGSREYIIGKSERELHATAEEAENILSEDRIIIEIDVTDQKLWNEFRTWMEESAECFIQWQLCESLNNEKGLLTWCVSRNHRTSAVWEMLDWIVTHGPGSYGLFYCHDYEDTPDRNFIGRHPPMDYDSVFRVHRLLNGELTELDDPFFGLVQGNIDPVHPYDRADEDSFKRDGE